MPFLAAVPAALGTLATASTATAAELAAASVTLTEATAVVAGTGAAVGGYSAYKQSQFQAAVAKNNATIADNNARTSLNQGQVAESASKLATGRKIGAALAGQGANGVDVGYGSPEEVRSGVQNMGDLDALTIRHNAASNALAYLQQSGGFTAESSLDKSAGTQAIAGAALNVGASYIGGASSVGSKYASFRTTGALPQASSAGN